MKLTRSPAGAALAVDRHEEKFLLNPAEAVCLRALLDGLLRRDRYSAGGAYYIRSLYFDTPDNTDYADKVLGVSDRRKLRLRLYDVNAGQIRLECKEKTGIYSHKTGVWVSRAQAARLAGAERLLRRYAEGDFSARLPRDAEGPLGSLFAAAEELATMLQAKTEAEHRARQFLKQTIADISHQLKTPLAALGLYQEIIAAEPDNADAVRAFAGKAGDALLRMESLIQAMLKITRLDAGSIRFAPAACPLPDLAGRAVRDLLTRAEREGKRIRLEGDPALTLWCDPDWTAEALGNLVKNGLDHTAAGGLVQVTWRHTPGMVQVQVADNGSGIAPEDIHHIFKRFYRGRSGPDARGAGLGLPLARAIVEGQGGAVTVQSTPGQGSVFAVSFPDGPDGLTKL